MAGLDPYTDGSLKKHEDGQDTGSGAELAAEAAAIIHGYSHIATDGLNSVHETNKQLSHPNLHRFDGDKSSPL